ncbi:hypothetical protein CC78DRAFT_584578 [Lojkania enalia]|uniref:Uncharacterized protein n=1 Tax=Lojkania enalia TaxID=147567 RepID=A0A9P4K4F0_9PLEO|nr:hypothetical protein CC78DRAFT_584578 [Didymosphaeria enalia]
MGLTDEGWWNYQKVSPEDSSLFIMTVNALELEGLDKKLWVERLEEKNMSGASLSALLIASVMSMLLVFYLGFEQLDSIWVDAIAIPGRAYDLLMLSTLFSRNIRQACLYDVPSEMVHQITSQNGILSNLVGNTTSILPHLRCF